jgi:hypothetical protein
MGSNSSACMVTVVILQASALLLDAGMSPTRRPTADEEVVLAPPLHGASSSGSSVGTGAASIQDEASSRVPSFLRGRKVLCLTWAG